eukprot:2578207-Amphidinium_carterae.1
MGHRMRQNGTISTKEVLKVSSCKQEMGLEGQPCAYQVQALSRVVAFDPTGRLQDRPRSATRSYDLGVQHHQTLELGLNT